MSPTPVNLDLLIKSITNNITVTFMDAIDKIYEYLKENDMKYIYKWVIVKLNGVINIKNIFNIINTLKNENLEEKLYLPLNDDDTEFEDTYEIFKEGHLILECVKSSISLEFHILERFFTSSSLNIDYLNDYLNDYHDYVKNIIKLQNLDTYSSLFESIYLPIKISLILKSREQLMASIDGLNISVIDEKDFISSFNNFVSYDIINQFESILHSISKTTKMLYNKGIRKNKIIETNIAICLFITLQKIISLSEKHSSYVFLVQLRRQVKLNH